jgi:hypothetical protein
MEERQDRIEYMIERVGRSGKTERINTVDATSPFVRVVLGCATGWFPLTFFT